MQRDFPSRRGVRAALAGVALVAALALAATVAAAPGRVETKRAQAEQLYEQLQAMDAQLERAVDAYDGASYELDRIEARIAVTARHLTIARRSFRVAERRLDERLVALYTDGSPDVVEVLLGAANLDDLLERLDSAQRISSQDARIVESVRVARATLEQHERMLERARAKQRQVVAERVAARDSIQAQLNERQAYYTQVKDEIAELVAEERERERRLAEQARREREEQRRLAAAAAAEGVDTSVVTTAASASSGAAAAAPEIAVPEGIGTAPASIRGAQAAQIALRYLGVPYVWGGASPSGFDCSGLVMYVYAKLGVSLPHHAATMYGYGVAVSYEQLAPGDLVFANGLGHMGMYIGGGNYVQAPQTGDVVKISSMSSRSDWVGFRRVA